MSVGTERSTNVVRLEKDVHEIVRKFSGLTGVPITRVLTMALTDWMSVQGAARIEALKMSAPRAPIGEVIKFPNPN